jgi:hypothetical protein
MSFVDSVPLDRLCGLVVRVPGYRPRGPGFDFRHYQIFWEVVGLEWGSLSLVRIIEELLEWKSSGSGSRKPRLWPGDPLRWPCDTIYQLKLALCSPTGCGHSVSIVCMQTKTTEFSSCCFFFFLSTLHLSWCLCIMTTVTSLIYWLLRKYFLESACVCIG